ncbi:secreted alpha-galactosidase [Streptomyces davaonensis JCM 4913]|uniref:Alpha-galactosidase n=1 Tax=Streptomyces davaonensis (strain DSM 101723 / JCM 4913 / KCC S-0913 / 768) TaxID=1214101 RepID=K4R0U7_STRDJ|nr:NPCBM/NEW2 domain-containing protein [Streptomyces davaonensis]CCK26948.1 secreted alpha-galactosidase [Streptomyces davaonensis JCM 4913]
MRSNIRRSKFSVTGSLALAAGLTAGLGTAPAAGAATPFAPLATPVAPLATPLMGWNSWNHFGCNVTQQNIKDAADQIVAQGLDKLGYRYVNVDDCWMARTRDAGGHLQPDPVRFKDGIRALADYVHSKGLKFGIYQSAGTTTCAGLPGSLGHETTDANDFAAWGVDLLKYDNCPDGQGSIEQRYKAMGDALKASGRAIVFSLCSWGQGSPWAGFGSVSGGSQWRTTYDIRDSWYDNKWTSSPMGVIDILDQQKGLEVFSGPSKWNDMDMLEVGNGALRDDEYRSHFSLWALLNSPLILGNDLTRMSDATKAIIKNADVIAVNQDWGGSQGRLMRDLGNGRQVWAKPMSDGSVAVVLLNRSGAAAAITTSAAEIGLGGSSSYALKDLWTGTSSTSANGTISGQVPSHGVAMYRVSRTGTNAAALPAGTHNIADLTWLASSTGWGTIRRNQSAEGNALTIGGTTYASGVGTHSDSAVHVWLGGECRNFTAQVGVDNEVGANGTVRFQVYGDGKLLTHSDVMRGGQAASTLTASTQGVKQLELRVTDARDYIHFDHADWANARVSC